jgi:arylsulfatase A-like enzyme
MRLSLVIVFLVALRASSYAAPNIVLLMGDDHGWEETGYHGHPHVKTPVLDEMAATGLRLDCFYAGHPSCSPTRGSCLTGRHPNRYGTFAPGWSLRPEEITVAQLLRQAGYQCGHFGKWHVGPVKAASPTSPGALGFHEWLSHDNFFELNPSLSQRRAAGGLPGRRVRGRRAGGHSFHRSRASAGQTVLHRRLVWLAARAVQRPPRRPRALRRLAGQIP